MKIERSIVIDAPPERIWPFLVEPEKILQWYLPLEEFKYISEQHGGVGTTFYYVEKIPTGSTRLSFKATEWVENQRFAFTLTEGLWLRKYNESYTIESTPSGSNFMFLLEAEFPWGVLGRLFAAIMGMGSKANLKKMLPKLKELVEAG